MLLRHITVSTALLLIALLAAQLAHATGPAARIAPETLAPARYGDHSSSGPAVSVRSAIIVPFRTANVPAEISGVIETVKFEKGDFVPKDAVVVEISKKRYSVLVDSARAKLKGLELALKHAERTLGMKQEVYSKHYGTMQKVLEAEAEAALTKNRVEEAEKDLALATLNLKACSVKAPFAGYLIERFKEPYEAVGQLEKLFAVADVSRVYAVGNVPEPMLDAFKKGAPAFFTDPAGKKRRGVVEKVEAVLNPESKTAKVNLLLDNGELDLKMGMTGLLALE